MRQIKLSEYGVFVVLTLILLGSIVVISLLSQNDLSDRIYSAAHDRPEMQGKVTADTEAPQSAAATTPSSEVAPLEVSQEGKIDNLRQNRDETRSRLEPFSQRVKAYLRVPIGKVEEPQERVGRSFDELDLPEIYEMLNERHDSNGYLDLLNAICILESDKSKAISAVMAHMNRPVDWKSFKENVMEYEDWKYRYRAISSLAYLNSSTANELLVSLLSDENARKIVVEAAGPKSEWVMHSEWREELMALKSMGRAPNEVWLEHSICHLRGGAAFGLMIPLDPSQFLHVESAYRAVRDASLEGQSVFDRAWENTLRNTIGRYRFLKEKGWNEGLKIVSEMDWENELALYMSYYPPL